MTRYMADSIDSGQIPSSVDVPGAGSQPISLRCGYIGGSYQQSSHTGPVDVNIDVDGSHPSADVLDIERGDATPDTAPGWVKEHNAVSSYPAVLYCNRATITAVANALDAAGLVVNKDYKWWIAILDGTQTVPDMTGVAAVQVWGSGFFPGHNIDLSIVYDDSWKNGGSNVAGVLTDTDVEKIFWGLKFRGNDNFAQVIDQMQDAINSNSAKLDSILAELKTLSQPVAAPVDTKTLLADPAFIAAVQNWKPVYNSTTP